MIELFAEKMTALLLEGYGYLTK
ncbi:TPA: hypothetical protein ACSK3D_001772, partial [Listeria monocytogenes]